MKDKTNDLGYIHTRSDFTESVPKVTWADAVSSIDWCYNNTTRTDRVPGFYLHSDSIHAPYFGLYHPKPQGGILSASQEVASKLGDQWDGEDLDLYISLSSVAEANGRHQDNHCVMIVQAIGFVSYEFDDGYIAVVGPGDSLYIPKFVYHKPKAITPRVTLSFGLEY